MWNLVLTVNKSKFEEAVPLAKKGGGLSRSIIRTLRVVKKILVPSTLILG
jgi:hypothetical protein